MKQQALAKLFTLFCLTLAFPCLLAAATTDLTIMSYNIRLNIASDGPNKWSNRKETLVAQIAFNRPDLLGIQEGLPQQVDYLDSALNGYEYVGVGRDNGKRAGEFSALFYRSDKLECLASDTFWLSETPDTPSYGWGVSYRRICTYGQFRDRTTGQTYWVFNTHFDHQVVDARLNGAKLILKQIEQRVNKNEAYFLIGDLNATPNTPEIKLLSTTMADARLTATNSVFGQEGTFNRFDPSAIPQDRIDYIFTSRGTVHVEAFATLSDLVDLRYPSDHFPIIARCKITNDYE